MSETASRPSYIGHRTRLRKDVMGTLSSTADDRLLEFLLTFALPRKDTKPLARALLQRFGNLRGVLDADRDSLLDVKGLGSGCADFFELLRELHARYEEAPVFRGERLCDNATVAAMARARLSGLQIEELWIALVDTRLHLLAWLPVSRGSINAALVNTQEIIRLCLKHHAWGFILVHNHPAGGKPSAQDIAITQKVEEAARAAGFFLLDHLVIMDNNYCGLREEGFLPPLAASGGLL